MKIRVVLITENDAPVANLGKHPEVRVKESWEMLLKLAEIESGGRDRGSVESVEILEG